jgi:uncharacterized membrane protein
MSTSEHVPDAVPSTAAIAGHPIHPMLVPLPIASLVGVVVTDLAYLSTTNPFWAEASRWLLLAGIVTGVLAAVFGLIDFLTISYVKDHRFAWFHFAGNGVALALSAVNLLSRPSQTQDGFSTGSFILSLVVLVILVGTGWLGGELSYRYRVGVMVRKS